MVVRLEHPWVEEPEPQLYVITYPAHVDEQELPAYGAKVEAFHRSIAEPFALVVNLGHLREQTAKQRAYMGELGKRVKAARERLCAAMAIVAPSAVQRGAFIAFQWISTPRYPNRVFSRTEEGLAWAREMLRTRREKDAKSSSGT